MLPLLMMFLIPECREKRREAEHKLQAQELERVHREKEAQDRAEQERQQELKDALEAAERELTGGYFFEHSLTAVLLPADPDIDPMATATEGPMDVESDDKVIVSPTFQCNCSSPSLSLSPPSLSCTRPVASRELLEGTSGSGPLWARVCALLQAHCGEFCRRITQQWEQ